MSATGQRSHHDAPPPIITFLSDYGHLDEFVGVCHGVIARRCPRARVIDLSHAIAAHDVLGGAIVLRAALPHMPAGVHLAVVDPGVGTAGRRALALRTATERRVLVGPDNGLLALAAEALGGVIEAVDIARSPERLEPVSSTFHGRDIFAPVAAALACGASLAEVGEPLAEPVLARLDVTLARAGPRGLRTRVIHRDRFGNLVLDASPEQVAALGAGPGDALEVHRGKQRHLARQARAFADLPAGELLLYRDSWGMIALAVNRGSAAQMLAVGPGDDLLLAGA